MLKISSFIKAAQKDPRVRQYLLKIADDAQFNETVPSLDEKNGSDNEQGMQNMAPKSATTLNGFPPVGMQQDQGGQDQGYDPNDPSVIAAQTAQMFLGPEVMQAALDGNQNAMELLSRTAAQVASSAAQGNFVPAQVDQGQNQGYGDPSQFAAVPNTVGLSPEDELANRIMGNQQPVTPSVNTSDSVDPEDQGMNAKEASLNVTADDLKKAIRWIRG